MSLEATDELKEWATTIIRDTLQMLPEEPATLNSSEKVARFQMRMSLVLYSLLQNVNLIPVTVFRFLHMMVVEGTLSIPDDFMLPFELRMAGPIILSN